MPEASSEPAKMAKLRQQAKIWRAGALPGLAAIACVTLARLTGSLQVLEWMAFDRLLQLRPVESADDRILIVGINERDIKQVGEHPIPDRELAELLQTLQSAKPRAIGLDLFRDTSAGSGRAELSQVLKHSSNLIGIEAALNPNNELDVRPPPELPPERVGLADVTIDPDGKLRRSLLASKVDGKTRYSVSLLLAAMYLKVEGIELQHGSRASHPIQFNSVLLPRFRSDTGGYVNAKAGGNQILLNFRARSQPFRIVSLTDVLTGKVPPNLIRDRIVLIGMTATSVNDTFMTSATKGTLVSNVLNDAEQYQLLYGVEYQAHATSQIVSAVLDRRPLIHTWLEGWEYVWIVSWGLLAMALGLMLQSPWKTLSILAASSICLISICYGSMVLGWWIPMVPALMALWAAGLTTSLFDRDSRVLLEQRSLTLKRTYDAVHNGPLQTLAAILRSLDETHGVTPLRWQLESLNRELRSVYESMKQELLSDDNRYVQTLLPALLYQIYEDTLRRDLPGFSSIKICVPPNFNSLANCPLTLEQKQGLCIFLEEALCNVGKHAIEATRLDVVCTRQQDEWSLQIIDNGVSDLSYSNPHTGRGTDRARELAASLRGKFERRPHSPQGVVCELTWRESKSWRQRLSFYFKRLIADGS
ncbi:MAG: CHASE2 domain-containing protein [Cyanosarcina radialis HA8281-LM2]|jgi:CHASE2 domain-containing sensor protein/two-component sensor histidine kinase|nr:CHASE2 domain-containing protein [Cyanosarcina radialis HA8281-LM2]